ncbi:threonine--tRNA ligase [Azoarcus indigens]|uniref:Threonine--tRNA ligase n=1 Tax=Azoarcus indigens TaxID=29545 RepID=A0A4R6E2R1_9RHOO|nr:threonine--tRNA ligase [Azoarcus indigens]NMG66206.1 threonine--tRNA ligase [Azoarcus indigens]TDN51329.1 threonyl-tRNA synthetase [Azoarcus indigens]
MSRAQPPGPAGSPIIVTLPDGRQLSFSGPVTVADAARAIGPGLARNAVAGKLDGRLVDTCEPITRDAELRILTPNDDEGLEVIRHSCAHLVGHAVKQLYPTARMVIGPVIADGFYYDIAWERPFTPADLAAIEARMQMLIAKEYAVVKRVLPRAKAIRVFSQRGEDYKLRLIEDMPEVQQMALYFHEEYVDMCRGPHVPNTRFLKAFKLTKLAGAYWRGDAGNEQLQRIYGTAWADKKQLDAYLLRLEEAEKRDHRKLGRELDLFHLQDDAPGAVFWHPRGWAVFQELIGYMRRRQRDAGYVEVNSPDVMDRSLWEISGHWQNYRDHMFTTATEDGRALALKPMNCPGSVLLYRHGLKSYRDLPLRMGEFGKVHRYEPSGSLHGLLRVRHFTQDDAHIYCTPQQMDGECREVVALVLDIYRQFGFEDIRIKLSTRPANRMGDDATWDLLEGALLRALQGMALPYQLNPGEGAFYGPKLEFVLRDAIGRDWQCGTLQVDMNLPERFGIEYVAEDGQRRRPVMLHRALFGSLERFTGILLEHHAGRLPAWLAPVQVAVLSITEAHAPYAQDVALALRHAGLRAEADVRNEKIGYKIREQTLQRTPFLLVAGDLETDNGSVAVRLRDGQDVGTLKLADAIAFLLERTLAPDQSVRRTQQAEHLLRMAVPAAPTT